MSFLSSVPVKKSPFLFFIAAMVALLFQGCSSPPPENMVKIPAGEFTMGSDEIDKEAKAMQYGARKPWYLNEHPKRKITLKEYYIDKTEVTNSKYQEFVKAANHTPPKNWNGDKYPEGLGDHPVTMVSWFDAKAYCEHHKKRLPTEEEWEKAARGTDERSFPWGNDFDLKKLNTLGVHGGSTPVGNFQDGASPYGVLDMAGNAQEWTLDAYQPYPGNTFEDEDYNKHLKTVRGGGWGGVGHYASQVYVRAPYRNHAPPGGKFDDVGFRCAW